MTTSLLTVPDAVDESRILTVTQGADGIAILAFNMIDRPMNVMSPEARIAFASATDRLLADDTVKGIILTSARQEFIAGADLRAMATFHRAEPAAVKAKIALLRTQLRKLEQAGKPLVAAMPGTALGGGLEIALACHHRIAVAGPKTVFGLPEVGLGLLPGAGGTQRLPRLIGVKRALPLLLEGRRLSAERSLETGFIDQVVPAEALLDTARAWIIAHPDAAQAWDKPLFEVPGGHPSTPENQALLAEWRITMGARTHGKYPAPEEILRCVFDGGNGGIDDGLNLEFDAFIGLATGDVAQNMIATGFFAVNDAAKLRTRPSAVPSLQIGSLGLIGSDATAIALATIALQRGHEVIMTDAQTTRLQQALVEIEAALTALVTKGRLSEAKREACLRRIVLSEAPSGLSHTQAVFDTSGDPTDPIKCAIGPGPLYIAVSDGGPVAERLNGTDRAVGLRIVEPASRTRLAEIITLDGTSDVAIAQAFDVVKALGKTPVSITDAPGHYVDRLRDRYAMEGLFALAEGIAPGLIEEAGIRAGMPTGPLSLVHQMGVSRLRLSALADDAITDILDRLPAHLNQPQAGSAPGPVGTGLSDLFPAHGNPPSHEALERRYLHAQSLEAVRAYLTGVIRDRSLADVASQMGAGFPAWTGGALRWVGMVGARAFAQECSTLEATLGPRFALPEGFRDAFDAS